VTTPSPSSSWVVTWRDVVIPLLAPRSRSVKVIMNKGPGNTRPQNVTVYPLIENVDTLSNP
jgi:hypothetical protein